MAQTMRAAKTCNGRKTATIAGSALQHVSVCACAIIDLIT